MFAKAKVLEHGWRRLNGFTRIFFNRKSHKVLRQAQDDNARFAKDEMLKQVQHDKRTIMVLHSFYRLWCWGVLVDLSVLCRCCDWNWRCLLSNFVLLLANRSLEFCHRLANRHWRNNWRIFGLRVTGSCWLGSRILFLRLLVLPFSKEIPRLRSVWQNHQHLFLFYFFFFFYN